jgi:uncharacterized protein YhbP (UPF0306 family)
MRIEGVSVSDVPAEVLDYINQQHTLTLATTSTDGVPRAATYLYVSDGQRLFFWTRLSSSSARNVQERPQVAFAIDEYADDLRQTRGVHGMGECAPVTGEDIARAADLFGQKYPKLQPGATTSIAFFAITPSELEFTDNRDSDAAPSDGTFGAEFHTKRV